MSGAMLMMAAWAIESLCGYPAWLYRRIRHPVVWIGSLVERFESAFNRPELTHAQRYGYGVVTTLVIVASATAAGYAISAALTAPILGLVVEAAIASSLIASRSLYGHVAAVATALDQNDIAAARAAVARIVGRKTDALSSGGTAGAALESLAENASDAVVAPLFWGVLFGIPGMAAYKAINTLDSMIGHRDERHAAFGGFAARLDDVANFLPARPTAFLIAIASGKKAAFHTMLRDARKHRSPNAGWPESAMAGALGVRLSGPRRYRDTVSSDPWLNAGARASQPQDLRRGLALYIRTACLATLLLASIAMLPGLL